MGLPMSKADFVGRALVYSATAREDRRVEAYGKERDGDVWPRGPRGTDSMARWNGRVIFMLENTCTELEEPIADLRQYWLGRENLRLTKAQQAATDSRETVHEGD